MPRCIFCGDESDKLSREHIFPAALGGKLELKNASCTACNNGFSKSFEQAIATRLKDFRYIFRIPDRYGKVPELFAKAEVEGKQLDVKLLRDGKVQLKPEYTITVRDGAKEIINYHVTEQQREKLLQEAKEKSLELIEESVPGAEAEVSISGMLDFIDQPDMLRTVAKVAYAALASHAGTEFALREQFKDVRTYIRSAEGAPHATLFLNAEYLSACFQGPHMHSVVLVGRKDKRRVDAIVRFFGGLCYLVNLAENYEGADFYKTLLYDAQNGEEKQVLVVNEQSEFFQVDHVMTSKDTVWNDRAKAGEGFLKFLDDAIQANLKARQADEQKGKSG
jgi:hypothetical protein